MKLIQILGTGCQKCERLAALAEDTAKEMQIEFQLEKVTELDKIIAFGVMITPALVVDGKVKVAGKVPKVEEIKKMLA
jgi:small redox-active disulfide protein 2